MAFIDVVTMFLYCGRPIPPNAI